MSDLDIRINGDASGAEAAFDDVSAATKRSEVTATDLAKAYAVAGAAIVAGMASAVKAYAESERIQKQLTRAAGDYAGALGEQAKALSKLYAVDDDVIKQSQVLLTQWGGVGAATNEVEKAALNLATAMGTDLKTSTEDLIRNVESGGVSLGKMGIHFATTGDKGKDLAAAVAAINAKLGGAAAADAGSLTGQLNAASIAFEDVKKSIGGSIAEFVTQTGAVGTLTSALRNLNEFLTGEGADKLAKEGLRMTQWVNAQAALADAQIALKEAVADPKVSLTILEQFQSDVMSAQKRVDALKASAESLPSGVAVTGETNKGMKTREADALAHAKSMEEIEKKLAEDWKKYLGGIDDLEENARIKEESDYAKELELSAKRVAVAEKEEEDKVSAMMLGVAKQLEFEQKAEKKKAEVVAAFFAQANEDNIKAMQAQVDKWASVGSEMGASFVNALSSQLQALAAGGEFDLEGFMADILGAVVGVAGTIISVAFPTAAPIVGAVTNLANMGIHAGFSALKKSNQKAKTFHSGGWVGDEIDIPRHHSGAWIGTDESLAILQSQERVLSRGEVGAMGGRQQVDHLAKGGGAAVNVFLQAIDSKSAADSFVKDLGAGMKEAKRRGQGDLPALLGAGPR